MKKKPLAAVGAVAAVGVVAGLSVTSFALFTDQETIGGNTFTAGTLDLTVDVPTALVTYSVPAMVPGDQDTAPLVVGNGGTADLRYALSSTTTEDTLAGELDLTVKVGVTTCDDANWATDGTVLYTGVLGTTGGSAIIGSNATGADAGDRTLVVSANETLCFNVTLPLSSSNSAQGLTTTASFTFDAEQTSNNP